MRVLGPNGWRDAFPTEEKKYISSIIVRKPSVMVQAEDEDELLRMMIESEESEESEEPEESEESEESEEEKKHDVYEYPEEEE